MNRMNRRNFLMGLGVGGSASALSACGWDDNVYFTPIEQVLPYVTRAEQVTPGTNSNFATVIGTGPRAWPVVAVHRDGRVINVGANRMAPVAAAVPATQLFDLQRHYSPDRATAPSKGGQPIAWDAGLAELTAAITAARGAGKKVVYLGPYRSGAIVELITAVTGGSALFWEPLGLDAEALAAKALFGPDAGLPKYDLGQANVVLSFGAAFLGDAWGNAGVRAQFAAARDANVDKRVARFVAVTPVKDQTAANADDWHACVPGSEAQVALAIARLVADRKGYQGPLRPMLDGADAEAAASASGIERGILEGIAAMFADRGAVALPGGMAGASMAATRLAAAVYALNVVSENGDLFAGGGYRGPIASGADLDALMADLEGGNVGVLMVDDTDPVLTLPSGDRFKAAAAKAGLFVSTSSFPSETAALAALRLPTHDTFEDWGDEQPWAGLRLLRQPGAAPLGDTRSLGDVLLDAWRAIDPTTAPTGNWRGWLASRWAEQVYAPTLAQAGGAPPVIAPDDLGFARWWERTVMAGFHADTVPATRLEVVGVVDPGTPPAPVGSGEYHLAVFAHPFKLDGRYANEPWAQEIPDPMTGQVWNDWIVLHPKTAAALGVADKDAVTITVDGRSIALGVEVSPCIRPDVVAVPLGGGHTHTSMRYAAGVGKRVASLLAPALDPSGALAWQTSKCTLQVAAATDPSLQLVSMFGSDSDHSRNFATVCDAGEWEQAGDAAAEHGGGEHHTLTGIHELPMDPRLVKLEEEWRAANPKAEVEHLEYTGFYPVPDHPTYRFAMTVDTNACTGCGACVAACYAENNLPVVGRWKMGQGRQMAWIRIDRFFASHTEQGYDESGAAPNEAGGNPSVHFVPLMCQHCGHAPCESVCPVLATYHTIDGLNAMVYNRCVGTRYCANACPYSARRFNYHSYQWPEPFNLQLNPDVTARTMGVMEKCTFCVQRIRKTKSAYRDVGFRNTVPDDALRQLTACAEACPSQAITFGNLEDPESVPAKTRQSGRNYMLLSDVNTFPAVNYLARASFHVRRPSSAHGEEPAAHGERG